LLTDSVVVRRGVLYGRYDLIPYRKFSESFKIRCEITAPKAPKAPKVGPAERAKSESLGALDGLGGAKYQIEDLNAEPHSAEVLAPSSWFARFAQPTEDEPNFDVPCSARRGRIEERDGLFLHFCFDCGAWGAYGYGINLRSGRLGRWYCAVHRPWAGVGSTTDATGTDL
jgi:hypothetical protein